MSLPPLFRQPSAFLPVAMSLVALGLTVSYLAVVGVRHEADENAVAHLFQLLMAAQVPIIGWFALRWLPRAPREGGVVLALQVTAALAALAPVFVLKL